MKAIGALTVAVLGLATYVRHLHAERVKDLKEQIAAEHEQALHARALREKAIAKLDAAIRWMVERIVVVFRPDRTEAARLRAELETVRREAARAREDGLKAVDERLRRLERRCSPSDEEKP